MIREAFGLVWYLVAELVVSPLLERLGGVDWVEEERRYRQEFLDMWEGQ